VVLQLFDYSVYIVGRPGGREKRLPGRGRNGTYHIDGSLMVADKPAVKSLVLQLRPLLKQLGGCRKIFLSLLAHYWVAPCCSDSQHHINYNTPGYLPRLGEALLTL
jgi:hypothetical protein